VTALCAALDVPAYQPARLRNQPAVAKLWRIALELDVIALRRRRVVPGGARPLLAAALRGDGRAEPVLELWDGVYGELMDQDAVVGNPELEMMRKWMRPWTPRFLGELYRRNGGTRFADVEKLTAHLLGQYAMEIPSGPDGHEIFTTMAAKTILFRLSELSDHGAVEMDVPSLPDLPSPPDGAPDTMAGAFRSLGIAPWVTHTPAGLRVRLTDLGRYAVRQRLLAEGASAPLRRSGARSRYPGGDTSGSTSGSRLGLPNAGLRSVSQIAPGS